jgi:hypothetical protein
MLENLGIDFEDPDIKSQLMSCLPYCDFDDPKKAALAINTKCTPELKEAIAELAFRVASFLTELLEELDPSSNYDDADLEADTIIAD